MTKSISDMTLAERRDYQLGIDAMRQIEYDIHNQLSVGQTIPKEWHEICEVHDHRDIATKRVTIRLDADVVKFFRALGPGYQPRINRVLRSFMHMRRAKVIEGPDTTDYIVNPARVLEDLPDKRPKWGEMSVLEEESADRIEKRARKRKMAELRESIAQGMRELEARGGG